MTTTPGEHVLSVQSYGLPNSGSALTLGCSCGDFSKDYYVKITKPWEVTDSGVLLGELNTEAAKHLQEVNAQ